MIPEDPVHISTPELRKLLAHLASADRSREWCVAVAVQNGGTREDGEHAWAEAHPQEAARRLVDRLYKGETIHATDPGAMGLRVFLHGLVVEGCQAVSHAEGWIDVLVYGADDQPMLDDGPDGAAFRSARVSVPRDRLRVRDGVGEEMGPRRLRYENNQFTVVTVDFEPGPRETVVRTESLEVAGVAL